MYKLYTKMRGGGKYQFRNGWRVSYYEDKKRKFKFFLDVNDADEFLQDYRLELDRAQMAISEDERFLIVQLRRAAKRSGIDLIDCAPQLLEVIRGKSGQTVSTLECFQKYLQHCESHGARPKTLEQYERYGMSFARAHKHKQVSEITRQEVLSWILTAYSNDNSRGFVRTAIVSCLRWAEQEKGWCTGWKTPVTWPRKKNDEKRIEILSPEQFKKLLDDVPPQARYGFALMGFAGIRPQEIVGAGKIHLLKWQDIDFEQRVIHVPGEVSKVRKFRGLSDLPENLWLWLEMQPKEKRIGPVVPCSERNFRKIRTLRLPKIGLDKWPQDVLRHSFGTYAYYYMGMDKTIEIMGHTGFKTFFRFYKSNGSNALAEQWFSITPSR